MPVYLLHGFRWPRPEIRIHIILQNLDDAAAEWLVAPDTTRCFRENFTEMFPSVMAALPNLRFVEQFDPADETTKSQPYAYVADTVHEISLGVDVDEARGRGVAHETWSAITELRDNISKDAKLAWYVVVCGDEERSLLPEPPVGSVSRNGAMNGSMSNGSSAAWSAGGRTSNQSNQSTVMEGSEGNTSQNGYYATTSRPRGRSISRGFKRMFGRNKEPKKSTSLKDIKHPDALHSSYSNNYTDYSNPTSPVPPLPSGVPPLPGTAR